MLEIVIRCLCSILGCAKYVWKSGRILNISQCLVYRLTYLVPGFAVRSVHEVRFLVLTFLNLELKLILLKYHSRLVVWHKHKPTTYIYPVNIISEWRGLVLWK